MSKEKSVSEFSTATSLRVGLFFRFVFAAVASGGKNRRTNRQMKKKGKGEKKVGKFTYSLDKEINDFKMKIKYIFHYCFILLLLWNISPDITLCG